ncbi:MULTISPECIES: metalloprotease [Methanobacterium]|jgi:Zn-dependent protease|uniref:Site-2 protease family protein n=1 Tax=Methanobacterium spitsbergense TaxID=2874285 RepID=A0A8T5URV5_9EURY|nr:MULTISPECIES: metalloprotease [Methanobacterium]MBZ2164696.1 site-2 protease family protein [Methanobacterium spitsbergense]
MVSFTAREVRDIIISMLVIAVIFAYLINGRNINENLILLIPSLLVAVGLGFVLHELAHKFVAVRYGFYAEFKMWLEGLIFALFTAFILGFVFVAPGAVYIHGEYISREQNGKISIAGPLVNIALALLFLVLTPFVTKNPTDIMGFIFGTIVVYGFIINSILAAFNLIPLGIFDGAKVLRWNPIIWGITFVVAIILAVKAYFGIY